MKNEELEVYNQIKKRIDNLEEEIYALTEARGISINPFKKWFVPGAHTKRNDYPHAVGITLTLEDIRMLQDSRLRELNNLKKILED